MTEALEACAPDFGEPDADVKLPFAGSDELAAQIRQGVEADVYAAANTKLPDELYAEDLLSKPVEFATNELVLRRARRTRRSTRVEDLARPGTTLAIGSESVPIGSYTREVLAQLPAGAGEGDPRQRSLQRARREGHRRASSPRGRRTPASST